MRILIAEDEARIATSLKKGFEQENYAADIARNGQEALDFCDTEKYDAMIFDVMMPVIDGITLVKKLREKKVNTPILMLTARDQTADKVAGLDAGADDYLVKPFSFEELLARVRALFRRPSHIESPVISIDNLTFDPNTYIVSRGGNVIKLTSKEFALLEFLIRNRGRVQSKDKIIAHVWDYDSDVLANTVEVYIKSVRDKIDTAYPDFKPLIQTVRGFGYKIVG